MAKKAKKVAAKKAAPKPRLVKPAGKTKKVESKPARVWQSKRGATKEVKAKRATRTPEQKPLIEGLRIPKLDRHCRRIGDQRAAIARMQGELKDMERLAHEDMRAEKRETWQAAGVTLVRVPGEERLRVTTSRSSDSTAPVQERETEVPAQDLQEAVDELGDAIGAADDLGNAGELEDQE